MTLAGPTSTPVALLATAPAGADANYDGATLGVWWEPIASPLVTGYAVSLITGTTAVLLGRTTGPSGSFTPTLDTSQTYSIVIQATAGLATFAPSAPVSLFTPALFLSTSATTSPSVTPAQALSRAPFDIVLYLPQLFTTPPAAGDLPSTPPFVLAPSTTAPFQYQLTIAAGSSAWTFTMESIRSGLLASYRTFLTTLQRQTATPIGVRTVQEAISRAMPQTFDETLYYGYGAMMAGGYVDLRPGMILHAEYESYQFLGPQSGDSAYLAGFVPSAVADYEISSYLGSGAWLTGLDAFSRASRKRA